MMMMVGGREHASGPSVPTKNPSHALEKCANNGAITHTLSLITKKFPMVEKWRQILNSNGIHQTSFNVAFVRWTFKCLDEGSQTILSLCDPPSNFCIYFLSLQTVLQNKNCRLGKAGFELRSSEKKTSILDTGLRP